MKTPTLHTARLLLRPFTSEDAHILMREDQVMDEIQGVRSVSDKYNDYAKEVAASLEESGVRVEVIFQAFKGKGVLLVRWLAPPCTKRYIRW